MKNKFLSAYSDNTHSGFWIRISREFAFIFENILDYETGSQMGSIEEKNRGRKSRANVPLIFLSETRSVHSTSLPITSHNIVKGRLHSREGEISGLERLKYLSVDFRQWCSYYNSAITLSKGNLELRSPLLGNGDTNIFNQ
jgi:hypothetical protein